MQYRTLGGTGTVVSAQCLGTMTFGQESSEEVAHAQLDRYVEAGGNFVDTANVYSRGASEEIVGRWLAARPGMRDRLVIATKGRFPMGEGPNDVGLSRTHLTRALEASLRRLQRRPRRPVPGARLGPADPARGDVGLLRRRGAGGEDPLRRGEQLRRLAAAEGRAAEPGSAAWRRS